MFEETEWTVVHRSAVTFC